MQKRTTPRPEGYTDRSPQAFSDRWGLSLSTTYKELRIGRLKGLKVGTKTIIPPESEQAWQDALPEWTPEADREAEE